MPGMFNDEKTIYSTTQFMDSRMRDGLQPDLLLQRDPGGESHRWVNFRCQGANRRIGANRQLR